MGRTVVDKKKDKTPVDMKDTESAKEFRKMRYGSIEMPCPACRLLMEYDGTEWKCVNESCPKDAIVEVDKIVRKQKVDNIKGSIDRFRKKRKGKNDADTQV